MMETNEFKVQGRWYWTADHARLVPEGSTEAAYLAYFDGQILADTEARSVGLLKVAPAAPANKMARQPANKRGTVA